MGRYSADLLISMPGRQMGRRVKLEEMLDQRQQEASKRVGACLWLLAAKMMS